MDKHKTIEDEAFSRLQSTVDGMVVALMYFQSFTAEERRLTTDIGDRLPVAITLRPRLFNEVEWAMKRNTDAFSAVPSFMRSLRDEPSFELVGVKFRCEYPSAAAALEDMTRQRDVARAMVQQLIANQTHLSDVQVQQIRRFEHGDLVVDPSAGTGGLLSNELKG
jgi:hypothetical protein